jgi:MoaA/NifB/PqqE/SkfB family radical SAM enzyme
MIKYEEIQHVHLELSTRCNAACPECPRNLQGINGIIDDFPICDLTLSQAKRIFTLPFLQQLQVILINGNYGDFITCIEALSIIEYFRNANSNLQITIQTNGSGQPKIWQKLAELNVHVQYNIDGNKDTNHLYRQNTNFDLIIKNAKTFIDAGGHAVWRLIKFDFNKTQLEEIQQLSQTLGFKDFFVIDDGRDSYHVFNKDRTYNFSVGNPNQPKDFQQLVDMYHSTKTSDKTAMYKNIQAKKINCKARKEKSIYVAANGEVYPCCWTGFFPKMNYRKLGNDQLRNLLKYQNNNAIDVGLENAVKWFNDLESTWQISSVLEGKNYICNETCGSN